MGGDGQYPGDGNEDCSDRKYVKPTLTGDEDVNLGYYAVQNRDYPSGVTLTKAEMRPVEARLERSKSLPKYDITIRPRATALRTADGIAG